MKLRAMPKHTAAELLLFLAENEDFPSVSKLLGKDVLVEEVKVVLREISAELMFEAEQEVGGEKYDLKNESHLSPQAKKIISYLSPNEEKTLLETFGLVDKK